MANVYNKHTQGNKFTLHRANIVRGYRKMFGFIYCNIVKIMYSFHIQLWSKMFIIFFVVKGFRCYLSAPVNKIVREIWDIWMPIQLMIRSLM